MAIKNLKNFMIPWNSWQNNESNVHLSFQIFRKAGFRCQVTMHFGYNFQIKHKG